MHGHARTEQRTHLRSGCVDPLGRDEIGLGQHHDGLCAALRHEPRVDLVCQESNPLRPGMGEGSRLLATCVHGAPGEPDPEALAQAMARMAAAWNPGYPWRDMATLEEVVVHPWAQFAVPPGVRDDLPDAATGLANVFLAGDFTAHPSIEGAVGSGERAADVAAMAVQRAVASGGH